MLSEDWSAEDLNIYGTITQMISDSSTSVYTNGVADSFNFMTQATEKKIAGTQQRIYVYGIGSGADMVVNNWLKEYFAPTFWGGISNVTMASATLEGLSDISGLVDNDIPTVSINNSDEINDSLEAANTSNLFLTDDERNYTAEAELAALYRRQNVILIALHYYASEGITEKAQTYTVNTSEDNKNITDATNDINYITYYSDDLEVNSTSSKVPLVVLAFHGGGNTALYEAQAN